MSQILGTFSSKISGNGLLKVTPNGGVTFEYDKPDGHVEEISQLGKNSNKKISLKMIEDAKSLSEEIGEPVCIYDIEDKKAFLGKIYDKNEKRDIQIDSLIYDDFYIDDTSILDNYPSINTYYDTETDSSDILNRHSKVFNFFKSIGFNPSNLSSYGIGIGDELDEFSHIENSTFLETSYTSNEVRRAIIRVKPNLMINLIILPDDYSSNVEFKFFFNRNRIINELSKIADISWVREQKIDKLLNIN